MKTAVHIEAIDVMANFVAIQVVAGAFLSRIPLDDVEAVWEAREDEWHVRVSGFIETANGRYISNPRNSLRLT